MRKKQLKGGMERMKTIVIALLSLLVLGIVASAFVSAETLTVSLNSKTNPSEKFIIDGKTFTIKIVASTDFSSTFEVSDDSGVLGKKEIQEQETAEISGVEIKVLSSDESDALDMVSATAEVRNAEQFNEKKQTEESDDDFEDETNETDSDFEDKRETERKQDVREKPVISKSVTAREAIDFMGKISAEDIEDSIDIVNGLIESDGKKLGFLEATIGEGFAVNQPFDSLVFLRAVWVVANIRDANSDSVESVVSGRIKIDKKNYLLILERKSEGEQPRFEFDVMDNRNNNVAELILWLDGPVTYDDGKRAVWKGQLENFDNVNSREVTLASRIHTVRKAADSEVSKDAEDASSDTEAEESESIDEETIDSAREGIRNLQEQDNGRGILQRIIDFFR